MHRSRTTWAVRDLPPGLEICFGDLSIFEDNKEALEATIPEPSDWMLEYVRRHFFSGGGPLILVPMTESERADPALVWERIVMRKPAPEACCA